MIKTKTISIPAKDGMEHTLHYERHSIRRFLVVTVDGEQPFRLPWGAREEIFRLGDEQAILCVRANGMVSVRTAQGEFTE